MLNPRIEMLTRVDKEMTRTSFVTGTPHGQIESACTSTFSLQTRVKPVHVSPYGGVLDLDGEVDLLNIPPNVKQELLRHLSNFVLDLDKIGGIIEETKPHRALIRRWRKLMFEFEGDVNYALKIVNSKRTKEDGGAEAKQCLQTLR
jgi:hypothetical protein